jgi:predicted dehydrogenase
LNWLFGLPQNVEAFGLEEKDPHGFRHAIAKLTYANLTAHVEGSWMESDSPRYLEIVGEEGRLLYDSSREEALYLEQDGKTTELPLETDEDPYRAELLEFIEWLRGDLESPLVTLDEAIDALRVSLAALRAVQEEQPVDLS